MADLTYPLFPIFAFLGFILAIIPLPWHLQALNSGTCFFMIWAALACLNQFVNSVTWAGNALNPAPVWCEISIRIMMGASVGIPASSLCINRRLYKIASVQSATITVAEKRRAVVIDSIICLLFPLLYIALQYVVQGHRFNIFEDIGCYPALYNTLLTYFISSMWPILIGLVSAVYCFLSLRSFARRRAEFSQFLTSHTSLTVGRYFRLMALAMTEICFTIPLSIFMIWLNATSSPIGPWRSWDDTHFAFSRIEQIPAVLWRSNHILVMAMEFSRWVTPLCAFTFFAFFGFADEAKRHYRLAFRSMVKIFTYYSRQNPGTPSNNLKTSFCVRDIKRSDSVLEKGVSMGLCPSTSTSFLDPPLHLIELKSSGSPISTDKKLPDTPLSIISLPSTYTLSAPTPTKSDYTTTTTDADTDADTYTISTFSYYDQSNTDPMSPLPSTQHRIVISEAFDASRAPSPVPSVPESVGPLSLYGVSEQDRVVVSPSPVYHRPFSPPSVYPVTVPQPSDAAALQHPHTGILVTIHRQASVDEVA
ncbi:hypothetical protein K443DRAFT_684535 [Laccaria amethystina LaAM-08-1]|uniref:Pheromone receptor n=1 Tax=Laccaria amethystina LaAM-08-1 TaxID=1095629 RepID=A0A0C9WQJ7_9AGAR|nr:hypothetical protein K443DRAFT_684535 [Laccaria amethystina LaAM-08-1]